MSIPPGQPPVSPQPPTLPAEKLIAIQSPFECPQAFRYTGAPLGPTFNPMENCVFKGALSFTL
eukprot:804812-Amorphochlora_amoeboformis.AAC.1